MMRKPVLLASIVAVSAALGLAGTAFADEEHTGKSKTKHDKAAAAFKKADKDGDGTLDRDEAKAMKKVAKHFDEIDADKDGTVTLDEIHTYMKAHKKK
jgi:Ca2+-binding EF-hand superfamily protein